MQSKEHSLKLNAEHVAYKRQTDLDDQGIAKNAREEKVRARGSLLAPAKPNGNGKPVQITPATPVPAESREEVGSFGD